MLSSHSRILSCSSRRGRGIFCDYYIIPRMMKVEMVPKVKMLRAV